MSELKSKAKVDFADSLFGSGRFKEALSCYRDILRNHEDLTADVQLSLVKNLLICLYRLDQYSTALEELQDLERLFRSNSIPHTKFRIQKMNVLINQADYDQALVIGEEAFETLRNTGENEAIAKVQQLLGVVHLSKGDLRKAKVCFEDALSTSVLADVAWSRVDTPQNRMIINAVLQFESPMDMAKLRSAIEDRFLVREL